MRRITSLRRVGVAWLLSVAVVAAQSPSATQKEITQAEHDVPVVFDALGLRAGMVVADVGAGAGAMTLIASRRLGAAGHVYATDVTASALKELRALVAREHLSNVDVIEGAFDSTQLPDACCDAIFLRDVYHHFTNPDAMNRSLAAALKPGGRLAVIDFEPQPGSKVPDGVLANRGGHGIHPGTIEQEVSASGLTFDRTILTSPDPMEPRFFGVLFRKSK